MKEKKRDNPYKLKNSRKTSCPPIFLQANCNFAVWQGIYKTTRGVPNGGHNYKLYTKECDNKKE